MKTFKKTAAFIFAALFVLTAFAGCAKKGSSAVKVIEIDLTDEEYAFGVNKEKPELLKQVNEFIKEIKENGEFDKICNKYFNDGKPEGVESAKLDSSKDQLVVATNAAFEPFEYKLGNLFYGIDMEIAALLAKKLNKELVIQHMDFDSVCLNVSEGHSDIVMAGLTVSEKRKKFVTFTDSYYKASQRLIVKADDTTFDNCKTKEDVEKILKALDDKTLIGGQTGTTAAKYVQGADGEFDGLKATWKGYKNGSLAVQDMINNNIKYVIIDSAPAKAISEAVNKQNG